MTIPPVVGSLVDTAAPIGESSRHATSIHSPVGSDCRAAACGTRLFARGSAGWQRPTAKPKARTQEFHPEGSLVQVDRRRKYKDDVQDRHEGSVRDGVHSRR